MNVNTSVYGEQSSWLDSYYLSTGEIKTKCANFTGGNSLAAASTLGVGNSQSKTPHNQLIEGSICFSALGNESYYSRLCYVNGDDIKQDNEIVTPFFYCENDRQNVLNGDVTISDYYRQNVWKTFSSETTNFSDLTVPIADLNPKKIVYVLQIICCDADGIEPSGTRWRFYGTYARNSSNIKTNYPYIKAARLNPRIDNGTLDTPNRISSSAFSDAYQGFGIAINREFTSIQNSDIKINYSLFRCIAGDQCSIMLYGMDSSSEPHPDDYYDILLCDPDDIIFDSYTGNLEVRHEATAEFMNNLIKQAACFGVYFRVYDHNNDELYRWDVATGELDAPAVFLGLLDSHGIGHGEYTSGAANRDNPIYNWSSYSESPYDYSKPVDPTHYDNTTGFYSMSPVWSCNRMYVTTEDNIMKAAQAIATAISLKPQDQTVTDYSLGSFLTNNPVDCIISIKKYPIQDIPKGSTQNIKFGAYENNQVKGAPLQTMHDKFDFVFSSGNNIFPVFGNSFLDYEPYSHAELIIPFCGSVQLPMADFMNATIKVKLIVDYITGACTAYVCKNDLAITSISGQIGIDVPISGVQRATLESQIVNANLQYKAQQLAGAGIAAGAVVSTVGAVGSVATGNAIGAIGSAGGLVGTVSKAMQHEVTEKAAEYAATHVQVPFKQVSAGSPLVSGVYEYACRLIIYRPILDPAYDPKEYGHTIGFATIETGSLNQHIGFVQVSSVDLSGVPCTVTESQMIEAALKEGVYV